MACGWGGEATARSSELRDFSSLKLTPLPNNGYSGIMNHNIPPSSEHHTNGEFQASPESLNRLLAEGWYTLYCYGEPYEEPPVDPSYGDTWHQGYRVELPDDVVRKIFIGQGSDETIAAPDDYEQSDKGRRLQYPQQIAFCSSCMRNNQPTGDEFFLDIKTQVPIRNSDEALTIARTYVVRKGDGEGDITGTQEVEHSIGHKRISLSNLQSYTEGVLTIEDAQALLDDLQALDTPMTNDDVRRLEDVLDKIPKLAENNGPRDRVRYPYENIPSFMDMERYATQLEQCLLRPETQHLQALIDKGEPLIDLSAARADAAPDLVWPTAENTQGVDYQSPFPDAETFFAALDISEFIDSDIGNMRLLLTEPFYDSESDTDYYTVAHRGKPARRRAHCVAPELVETLQQFYTALDARYPARTDNKVGKRRELIAMSQNHRAIAQATFQYYNLMRLLVTRDDIKQQAALLGQENNNTIITQAHQALFR